MDILLFNISQAPWLPGSDAPWCVFEYPRAWPREFAPYQRNWHASALLTALLSWRELHCTPAPGPQPRPQGQGPVTPLELSTIR